MDAAAIPAATSDTISESPNLMCNVSTTSDPIPKSHLNKRVYKSQTTFHRHALAKDLARLQNLHNTDLDEIPRLKSSIKWHEGLVASLETKEELGQEYSPDAMRNEGGKHEEADSFNKEGLIQMERKKGRRKSRAQAHKEREARDVVIASGGTEPLAEEERIKMMLRSNRSWVCRDQRALPDGKAGIRAMTSTPRDEDIEE